MHGLKDGTKHSNVVFEGEIAHESEGALGEGDHWWNSTCVELLGRPQNRAIATQSDDVIDLIFVLGGQSRREAFCQTILLKEGRTRIDLVKQILREDDLDAELGLLLTLLDEPEKLYQVLEDGVVPWLDKDEELGALWQRVHQC